MSECNDFAPHDCVQCGSPSYIGFGLNPLCTNYECLFFNRSLWVDWVMATPDYGDPPERNPFFDIDEDAKTDPMGFALVKFRDFCSNCHNEIDFTRSTDPVSGTSYAFCTACGQPNVWS